MRDRFLLFDRWNNMVCELSDVTAATYRTKINGEDTLELEVPFVLSKGDRILWSYADKWHENVVNESTQEHSGYERCSYVCDGALQWDLNFAHIKYTRWTNVTAQYALTELLKLTTWTVGTVDIEGTASFEWTKKSAYEALLEIAGAFNCELLPEITVDKHGVSLRSVSLVKQRGSEKNLRFDYAYNLDGVTKEVLADDVITACYGYGKSNGQGDTSLTFASINGGKPYVEDLEALERWGLPDGHGGKMHAFGYYENTDCDNAKTLLDETTGYLKQHNTPQINYTTHMPFAVLQGVELGDVISVTDKDFTPSLRLRSRVGEYTEDLIAKETTSVEFGAIQSLMPDVLSRAFRVAKIAEQTASTVTPGAIMEGMNAIYTSGGSNICQLGDSGIITANVALDGNGAPMNPSDSMVAVRFASGRFYSATTYGDGGWEWSEMLSATQLSANEVVLVGDGVTGTLSVRSDGLYFNGEKIGGA